MDPYAPRTHQGGAHRVEFEAQTGRAQRISGGMACVIHGLSKPTTQRRKSRKNRQNVRQTIVGLELTRPG